MLASAGARLTVGDTKQHRELPAVDIAPATLALEAETLADPPDVEDDESAYWTRVFELAAVVGEVIRARRRGRWIESDGADTPF